MSLGKVLCRLTVSGKPPEDAQLARALHVLKNGRKHRETVGSDCPKNVPLNTCFTPYKHHQTVAKTGGVHISPFFFRFSDLAEVFVAVSWLLEGCWVQTHHEVLVSFILQFFQKSLDSDSQKRVCGVQNKQHQFSKPFPQKRKMSLTPVNYRAWNFIPVTSIYFQPFIGVTSYNSILWWSARCPILFQLPSRNLTRIDIENSQSYFESQQFSRCCGVSVRVILPIFGSSPGGGRRSQVTQRVSVWCFICSITKGFLTFPVDDRRSPGGKRKRTSQRVCQGRPEPQKVRKNGDWKRPRSDSKHFENHVSELMLESQGVHIYP